MQRRRLAGLACAAGRSPAGHCDAAPHHVGVGMDFSGARRSSHAACEFGGGLKRTSVLRCRKRSVEAIGCRSSARTLPARELGRRARQACQSGRIRRNGETSPLGSMKGSCGCFHLARGEGCRRRAGADRLAVSVVLQRSGTASLSVWELPLATGTVPLAVGHRTLHRQRVSSVLGQRLSASPPGVAVPEILEATHQSVVIPRLRREPISATRRTPLSSHCARKSRQLPGDSVRRTFLESSHRPSPP